MTEKLYFGYYVLGQYLAQCFDPLVPVRQVIIYAKEHIISESEDVGNM